MRERREVTAIRTGCSLELIALHERRHECWDGLFYTRPPCLLTDPERHLELLDLLTVTRLVLTGP